MKKEDIVTLDDISVSSILEENGYSIDYENYHVNITEDSEYYHIDFSTGLGEAHYHKSDWTLEEALKDQAEM